MRTVREVFRSEPVWVSPDHTVESASVLMRGHGICALPVLDGQQLLGVLSAVDLLGSPPGKRIGDLPLLPPPTVSPDTPVRDAADAIASSERDCIPVFEEGRLVGLVSVLDLLPDLRKPVDPLTRLPWSSSLREWAVEQLKAGNEITVLFMDVDRFGAFNKLHGHIVGDRVLESVASALRGIVNLETDILCRYGGDEFCIATLRTAEEAAELADAIVRAVQAIDLGDVNATVSCHVGRAGGKRTREREHTHYMATLNSLINLASRDCMEQKEPREGVEEPERRFEVLPRMRRIRLARIELRRDNGEVTAQVDLEMNAGQDEPEGPRGGRPIWHRFSASRTQPSGDDDTIRLVADTTAAALRLFLPGICNVVISDVIQSQTTNGQSVVTTVGAFHLDQRVTHVAGSALVTGEPCRAAARSVLAAVNRCMGLAAEK